MIHRRFPISRRTLLRGTGVALGLPWLEVMSARRLRAATAKSRPPVQMAVLYMPNGVHPDMWTPEGEGRDFKLSPTLQPLSDLKNEIVVPTNLWNQASKGGRALCQSLGLPDLHHHHEDAGRRSQLQRRLDGSGGCASRGKPDAAAVS